MSGILWQEIVKQGKAKSRNEVRRLVKQKAIEYTVGRVHDIADYDDLELPGKTVVKVGKYRLVEIPVTPPEDENGCTVIRYEDVKAEPNEPNEWPF